MEKIDKGNKIKYKCSIKKCYKVFFQNRGDRDFFIKEKMIKDNFAMLPGSGCNLIQHSFVELPAEEEISFIFIGKCKCACSFYSQSQFHQKQIFFSCKQDSWEKSIF